MTQRKEEQPRSGSLEEAGEYYQAHKNMARRVIDHPEAYFKPVTEEQEKLSKKRFKFIHFLVLRQKFQQLL